ncbi:MAG TPA: isoaspartyl peptidase/L-asparaginase [Pyrinomonadaceae bacterium]|nr:isoaspartyl peptidase/L-asparaginase [Pyrinomonadaceae bacterium]
MAQHKLALAIHGGAGTILRSLMTDELEREYRSGLADALKAGWEILEKGGSSLDAVQAAVCSLENFYLFNAGRGAVFTHEGKNEMDASIMDGKALRAGAVAFVRNVKNPIDLARLVMDRTEHVLLGGDGANKFAAEMGVEMADDDYFHTDHRYAQLLKAREEGVVKLDHDGNAAVNLNEKAIPDSKFQIETESGIWNLESGSKKPLGTVGAVACDINGDLAAATSTGGMTNKKFGRIGDTPLVGSGTYADNKTCAVSCTGHGEFFMLGVTAYDVAARMKYKNIRLEQAARETIEYLTQIGGEGGLIAVDAFGNFALPFNSEGMYRGWITAANAQPMIEIYQ